jgi:hypothetical protein
VRTPHPESGDPPGGDDYTNPHPEPGAVRHDREEQARQAIERASQLVKDQAAKQTSS